MTAGAFDGGAGCCGSGWSFGAGIRPPPRNITSDTNIGADDGGGGNGRAAIGDPARLAAGRGFHRAVESAS